MPEQTPYVPNGLREAVDIFFIQQLKTLLNFYVDQQGQPLQTGIDVKALYTKLERATYPVVTVMTGIADYEPVAIGDFLDVNEKGNLQTFSIYMAQVNLHVEAVELRELERVVDFIYINFDKGSHPENRLPWIHWFINNGIEILRWENDLPRRVTAQSIQQRTARAQGPETEERTDIETLWSQDCCIHCRTQVAVEFINQNGVITGITFNLTPDLSQS